MADSELRFHHVGLLTDQPGTAAQRLSKAGYRPGTAVLDPLQGATLQLCFGPAGASTIELITPSGDNKPLNRLLKRRGDYMYHVCFTTPSFEYGLETLADNDLDRIVTVAAPAPAVLFDNARVAFYLVPGLGLIELLEQN